jgi:hypothetical protein
MKKFLVTGALALAAVALFQQQASAWKDCKFGIGLNWHYSSGGNNCLWGAFKNGQPPGCPDCINCGPNCPGTYYKNYHWYGAPPMGPSCADGGFGPPMAHGMGFGPEGPPMAAPPGAAFPPAPAPAAPNAENQVYWFNAPAYRNVNYNPGYYPQGYFMPVSGYYR